MLVQLGKRNASLDVVDLLLECHGRIRRFLVMAWQLAKAHEPPREEIEEAASQIRRYFAESFPLHMADEELDIAPRIADASIVERMCDDHRAHASQVADLVALCDLLRKAPERHAALRTRLGEVARQLGSDLESHMELEETELFPAIRRLDADEQAAIVSAIQRRRQPHA